jgi:hypothetical protein
MKGPEVIIATLPAERVAISGFAVMPSNRWALVGEFVPRCGL